MTMELNATHVGSHLVVLAGERGDEFKPMVSARRLIGLQGPVTIVPADHEIAVVRSAPTAKNGMDWPACGRSPVPVR